MMKVVKMKKKKIVWKSYSALSLLIMISMSRFKTRIKSIIIKLDNKKQLTMSNNEEMISLELALSKVPDRYSFHLGLLRNQVVMPPLKDAINNADFMQGIIEGRYWHLRSHEVQYRVCADMPSKKELADILYRVMQEDEKGNIPAFRATAELVKAKPPSPEWLVLMIGSLKPDHAIFDRGYVKPKVVKAGAASAIV